MSREDWEVFDLMKQERKEKRAARRAAFDPAGWTKHHDTHYSRTLLGDRLDYWPGPKRWRWRGRSMNGNVEEFIAKREREADA